MMLALFALGGLLQQAAQPTAFELVDAFGRLTERELWPGFDPAGTPLLVFDGEATYLFGFEGAPPGFEPAGKRTGIEPDGPQASGDARPVFRHPGRHSAVRANTSIDFEGRRVATFLWQPEDHSLERAAAVLVHETFHVFQDARHPEWQADEGQLLVYPFTDAAALALRRLETEALTRALAADGAGLAAAWSKRACELRAQRAELTGAGPLDYERGLELYEGLAQYVERSALGERDVRWPADGYGTLDVRLRAYDTGQAWALLLDRFAPGWPAVLEPGAALALDLELARRIRARGSEDPALDAAEERASAERARAWAEERTAALAAELRELESRFEDAPGWRIEVRVDPTAPLWPQGFDPLNVTALGGGKVLHGRWVKLGNDSGEIEVLDREALSLAAGSHPLFEGVRAVHVTGLAERPTLVREHQAVTLECGGVRARFPEAQVDEEARVVLLVDRPR